jgi:Cytochrome c7 and related cytochrome c
MSRSELYFAVLLGLVVAAFASLARAEAPPGGGTPTGVPAPAARASAASSGSASRRGFTEAIPCSACHTTTAWRAKDASGEEAKFDHAATGFPLTGAHVHAPCVACHDGKRAIKRACASCHDDFHRGRLLQSCDMCHSPAGWTVTRPLEIHRMTRFPLTGMHVLADCTECHVRASEHRWTDAPIDCFACHEKDYRRPGIEPVHAGTATSPPLPRDCSLCHRAVAWVPAAATGSTASPLASLAGPLQAAPPGHDVKFPIGFGAHRGATCDDCHASLRQPRAVRCIGCHAHDALRLVSQHRQPIATDGASCLGCHPGGTHR